VTFVLRLISTLHVTVLRHWAETVRKQLALENSNRKTTIKTKQYVTFKLELLWCCS